MTRGWPVTIIGVDAHKRSHTLVAIDPGGRKLAEKTVTTTPSGHAEAIDWVLKNFGADVEWAVEDNRSFTHLLERDLLAAAPWRVVRCPPALMARTRASARTPGKSDPIDALAVARAALRETDLPVAVHDDVSWQLRQLVERREDLVTQRAGVMHRVYAHVHLLDPTRPTPTGLDKRNRRDALGRFLRTQSGLLAELARDEVDDLEYFTRRIDSLTERIVERVDELHSSLLTIPGCAHLTAAKFIGEAANMDRFRSEAAFAAYCGVAPVPRWSGSTAGTLRVSNGGNRQLNTALHRVALVQLAKIPVGRTYYERRRAEGDTGAEAIRRLKRKLCRLVFNRLRADYRVRTASDTVGPAVAVADVGHVPAWLQLVDIADSMGEERERPRRSVGEHRMIQPGDAEP
ncbi:IS110 family transposase [Mycolicibacterium sp. P1-18]|uniref:IS110 family transposase n=1 Tax=Mycolicibacterium sp. P1-18 TaxID=2024615 RepID=UPI00351A5B0F